MRLVFLFTVWYYYTLFQSRTLLSTTSETGRALDRHLISIRKADDIYHPDSWKTHTILLHKGRKPSLNMCMSVREFYSKTETFHCCM